MTSSPLLPVSHHPLLRQWWLRHLRLAGWQILAVLLFSLGGQVLAVLLPVSLGQSLGQWMGYRSLRGQWLAGWLPGWFDTPWQVLGMFGAMLLAKALFDLGFRYLRARIGLRMTVDLQRMLFAKHLRTSISTYHQRGSSRYLLRWSGDLRGVRQWIAQGVFQLLADALLLTLAVVWLGVWQPYLLMLWLPAWLLAIVGAVWLGQGLHRASSRQRDTRSRVLKFVAQRLAAMESVQAFNRQVPEQQRLDTLLERQQQDDLRYARWHSFMQALAPAMVYSLLGILLITALLMPQSDPLRLLPAVLLVLSLTPVCRRLLRVVIYWADGHVACQKIGQLLDAAEGHSGSQPLVFRRGELQVEGVVFTYPGQVLPIELPTLRTQGPGLYHWSMGMGEGRTTLLRLLTGLYQPQQGQILIDGQRSDTLTPDSLRRHIAVVSEAWPLLGRNVFEAISYSRKASKRDKAQRWLDRLQAALPPSQRLELDDPIGEGGCLLSLSQRRILSYARAMLTRKPILVVEDPWLGLSPQARAVVEPLLQAYAQDRSVVLLGACATTDTYFASATRVFSP
ncbi:MAG: ABC transporter ATP-binding protein [Bacteroidia bacterium]